VWIVAGFSLTLIAAMISLGNDIGEGVLRQFPASEVTQVVVYPLNFISALFGWWFLSSMFTGNVEQVRLARRAFVCLSLQFFLLTVVAAATLSTFPLSAFGNFVWQELSQWFDLIGVLATSIGFFVLQSSFASTSQRYHYLQAFEASLDEEGDDIPLDDAVKELES
jgi:hypothetical protein